MKDRNSGGITDFALPYAIPEVRIKDHVFESLLSTLKEVFKHAKRLEYIATSIENFISILANEKLTEDFL